MNINWWFKPSKLLLFFIFPIYLLVVFRLSVMDYTLTEQLPYKSGVVFFYGGLSLFVFYLGAFFGEKTPVKLNVYAQPSFLRIENSLVGLGLITIVAYLIWFTPLFLNFGLMKSIITGVPGVGFVVRSSYSTIPGVTTLTQLGVVFACVYIVYIPKNGYKKSINIILIILVLLTLFRALAWSERLAIIEFFIPLVVGALSYTNKLRLNASFRFLLPFIGIFLVVCLFIVFEYRRSWLHYYIDYYDSIVVFGLDRFLEYYLLAINNGAGLMVEFDWPTWQLGNTLGFMKGLPVLNSIYENIFVYETDYSFGAGYLYLYGDEEFNNMSGIFTIPFEIGVLGWFLFFSIGYVVGIIYSYSIYYQYAKVAYLCIYVGMLELLRVFYFSEGRFIAVCFGLAVFWFLLRVRYGSR